MVHVAFSLSLGLLIAMQSLGGPLCTDFLGTNSKLSTGQEMSLDLRQPRAHFHWIKPAINSRLGEGLNGTVNLIELNGQTIVLKTYKSHNTDHFSQIQRDYRSLRFLRKNQASFSFKVPDFIEVQKNQMRLTYFEGRSLEDLLADPQVSSELKITLHRKFSQALDEVQAVVSDFQALERKSDYLKAEEDSFASGDIFLIIKSSNFIVNPRTLEFALIDPH